MKKKVIDILILKESKQKDFLSKLKNLLNKGYEPYIGNIEIHNRYNSENYITTVIKYEDKAKEESY